MLFPQVLASMFSDDLSLIKVTSDGMRYYLCMLPLIGLQTVGSQYFQVIGKARLSSVLAFLRYGIILVPAILLLAPIFGVKGIYISNALSDGIASIIAIFYIWIETYKTKEASRIDTIAHYSIAW